MTRRARVEASVAVPCVLVLAYGAGGIDAFASCALAVAIVGCYGISLRVVVNSRSSPNVFALFAWAGVLALAVPVLGVLVFLWSLAVDRPFVWSLAVWGGIIAFGVAWAWVASWWDRNDSRALTPSPW